MTMKQHTTFKTISDPECLRIYPAVAANAQEFYRSGEILCGEGLYGKAISMLILGAEEYVKALCLMLDGYGCNTRKIQGMEKIFFTHDPRHRLSRDFLTVWTVLSEFLSISASKSFASNVKQAISGIVNLITADDQREWWLSADKFKQNGFYVDYIDEPWTPATLNRTDYEKAWSYTREIPVVFKKLSHYLSGLTPGEVKQFVADFKMADFESLIKEALQRKN